MSTRVLLDTQVLVHAYIGDVPLPSKVHALLCSSETVAYLSTVSIMEVAMKHEAGKLKMGAAEMRQAIRDIGLQVIPFGPEHALRLYGLAQHHRDPFDRMLDRNRSE